MTSVIVCTFDQFKWQRHITLACLNALRRFTDQPYELILVDQIDAGTGGPYNRWEIIKPDKQLFPGDIGYSAAMNLGVRESNPDSKYLVFMHSDVYVQEGWLGKLIDCHEKGLGDVIYPDQIARPRQQILDSYRNPYSVGYDEAGLMLMSRETFNATGGWDERFKAVYQDMMFQRRLVGAGKTWHCTMNTFISHIGSVGYAYSTEAEQENINKESQLIA